MTSLRDKIIASIKGSGNKKGSLRVFDHGEKIAIVGVMSTDLLLSGLIETIREPSGPVFDIPKLFIEEVNKRHDAMAKEYGGNAARVSSEIMFDFLTAVITNMEMQDALHNGEPS